MFSFQNVIIYVFKVKHGFDDFMVYNSSASMEA